MIGVELFEDDGVALVIVPDYQLSLAIGRDGQNVRLAARLTGWRLDIASETESADGRASATWSSAPSATRPSSPRPTRKRPSPRCPRVEIDAELIRKLEEFRRERLGQDEG